MFPDITVGPRELIEADTNKTGFDYETDPEPRTLLTVDIADEELVKLTSKWSTKWTTWFTSEEKSLKEAEDYWLGRQYNSIESKSDKRPIVDNLIFESLETFLPEATKRNAEPVVTTTNNIEGKELAKSVKIMLSSLSDTLRLRLKVKRAVRYWAIYRLGAIKVGWNPDIKEIFTDVVLTRKLIMDPDATIDDGGVYTGEYLGEKKEATAEKLMEMFPEHKDYIKQQATDELGTMIRYVEWWTKELLFFTCGNKVLTKYRNPHWNYNETEISVDEFGNPVPVEKPGMNHFDTPEIPYIFISMFNLGKHPLDDTSLIQQNLANQDRINSTLRQIVRNVKKMNAGAAFAAESFTKEEAAEAQDALDAGDGVWVPAGDINSAFKPYSGTAMPADVFNHLVDMRNELRNIFGVRGSSAQGVASEQTVRGKVIVGQKDSSRIGGGISEHIEQACDRIFNWWVQLMYVYYDEEHIASVVGKSKAEEIVALQSLQLQQFIGRLIISVKEGSMLPKDELTEANQAIELASANLLSPIDLYNALDYPDPMETAKNLFLWNNMPQLLFPDIAPAAPPPAPVEGDLPPEDAAGPPEEAGALPPLPMPNLQV